MVQLSIDYDCNKLYCGQIEKIKAILSRCLAIFIRTYSSLILEVPVAMMLCLVGCGWWMVDADESFLGRMKNIIWKRIMKFSKLTY